MKHFCTTIVTLAVLLACLLKSQTSMAQYRIDTVKIALSDGTYEQLRIRVYTVTGRTVGSAAVIQSDAYKELEEVVIPDTVRLPEVYGDTAIVITSIYDYAFKDCRFIKKVTFPESLTGIDIGAFQNCAALTSVSIPRNVVYIDNSFVGCSSLESIELNSDRIREWFGGVKSQIRKVTLGPNVRHINTNAFYGMSNVKEIVFPDSVKTIGDRAFWGWQQLTSVVLPKGLTSISSSSFHNCMNLRKIRIYGNRDFTSSLQSGDSYTESEHFNGIATKVEGANELVLACTGTKVPSWIRYVRSGAFSNTGITRVTLPVQIKKIEPGAFENCIYLDTLELSGTQQIYNYKSPAGSNCIIERGTNTIVAACRKTVIPEGVKGIAPGVFAGITSAFDVTLPKSFTKVPKRAFAGCTGLRYLTLPETITEIDTLAFNGCKNLRNFKIPASVKTIAFQAFRDCWSLDTLTIPCTVEKTGESVWYYCNGLKKVTIEAALNERNSFLGIDSLKEGTFAFCSSLEEVVMPNRPTFYVGPLAFRDCGKLRKFYCPNSYPTVFYNNENDSSQYNTFFGISLENITLYARYTPNKEPWTLFGKFVNTSSLNVLIDGIYYNLKTDDDGRLYAEVTTDQEDATGREKTHKYSGDIVIPNYFYLRSNIYHVTSIEERAFKGNKDITSVTVGESMKTIGFEAFEGCTALTKVDLSEASLYDISYSAFKDCESLSTVLFKPDGDYILFGDDVFAGCRNLKNIKMPAVADMYGDRLFKGCSRLDSITLPQASNQDFIGRETFYGCDSLVSVKIPDNIRTIQANAFGYCKQLKGITLPKALREIGDGAFRDCSSLPELTIPANTQTISTAAFQYCTGLTSVTLPDTLKAIQKMVFANCGKLKTVSLPKKLRTIGESAFQGDGSLTSITFEENVQSIGEKAFMGCPLENIYCRPVKEPTVYLNSFSESVYGSANIYLPESADSTYWKHPVWKLFYKGGTLNRYALTYVVDGDTIHTDSIVSGNLITPIEVEPKGTRRFSGWIGVPELMPAKDSVIRGNFMYEAVFMIPRSGNEQHVANDTIVRRDSLFCGDALTAPKSWKQGYSIRWQGLPPTMPAADTTVVGRLVANNYDIVFCQVFEGDTIRRDTVNAEYGSDIVPVAHAEKAGYAFQWLAYPAKVPSNNLKVIGKYIPQVIAGSLDIRINKEADKPYAEVVACDKSVASITVPDSVTHNGLTFPVTSIGTGAFSQCTKLTEVTLPRHITILGTDAFRDCHSLAEITLPECLKTIGDGAFSYCSKLKKIEFPESLTFNWSTTDNVGVIGSKAFYSCTALDTIISRPVYPPYLRQGAFDTEKYHKATLMVPRKGANYYEHSIYWDNFRNVVYLREKADVNDDGDINALDIQEAINEIVADGSTTTSNADVNGDGTVNALDIQDIINAIVSQ